MAGLDPAIHVLFVSFRRRTWMPGIAGKFTRSAQSRLLWPGMPKGATDSSTVLSPASVKTSRSPLQEFAGLVERAKRKAGLPKVFCRAFFPVDHGEHHCNFATAVAHRFDRLHR